MNRRPANPAALELAIARAAAIDRKHVESRLSNARNCLRLFLQAGPDAFIGWQGLAGVVMVSEAFGELGIGRGDDATRILQEATDTLAAVWRQAEERKTWAMTAEQRAEVSERCGVLLDLYAVQLRSASQGEHERAFRRAKARGEAAQRGQYGKGVTVVGA